MKLKNQNTPIDLRPKCKIYDIEMDKETVIKTLQTNLINGNDIAVGLYDTEDDHFELKIPPSQRHFWSPKMHIWINENNGNTSLSCVIGPNFKIWNIFIALYVLVILFTLVGVVLGFIQRANHEVPYFFWAAPLGLFFILLINLAARIGQYWGKAQVSQLKSFISMTIDKKI
ncbi:MAG TPA: hypothetical protein ENI82_02760 [Bacteroidetes bacterium]|nr:hypothetical protein [Bacteroidota bacterium]